MREKETEGDRVIKTKDLEYGIQWVTQGGDVYSGWPIEPSCKSDRLEKMRQNEAGH